MLLSEQIHIIIQGWNLKRYLKRWNKEEYYINAFSVHLGQASALLYNNCLNWLGWITRKKGPETSWLFPRVDMQLENIIFIISPHQTSLFGRYRKSRNLCAHTAFCILLGNNAVLLGNFKLQTIIWAGNAAKLEKWSNNFFAMIFEIPKLTRIATCNIFNFFFLIF